MEGIRAARRTLLLCAVLAAGAGATEIYKTTGDEGEPLFSQTPPPAGQDVEILTPKYSGPPAAVPAHGDAPAAVDGAAAEPEATTELTAEQQANKAKNCSIARERLAQLNVPRANRLQYVDENGERAFYTPTQLSEKTTEAETAIAKWCS